MDRLQALREKMAEQELDALFLHQRENVLYMTGFSGTTGGLYVTEQKAFVLVDSRYEEQAKDQCPDFEVVLSARPYEIAKVMNGEKRIGFEEDVLTYEMYHLLKAEAGENVELVPSAEIMRKQRMIKD
ncbi:MAG: aminopeptidase P family N-terminal domain-containing protein, partial [Firmicutes bacterium]|nr:aminopeptidase P family N-terminal domain-containing protein [Bacillota bacterium]